MLCDLLLTLWLNKNIIMRFDELLYNDSVLDGLDAMGFETCTPIQEQAIPPILAGNDLLGIAQTGTGKTAAYLLPVIDLLADGGFPNDAINCVVMAPTRELAQQIDLQMQGFAYFMPVTSIAIYGGTDGKTFDQQKEAIVRGADVVIATPGRLLAHQKMGYVDLSKVSFFVLDEADRMLDMGFYDDIMHIYNALPENVQVLLFSATMPPKITRMAKQILKNPSEVYIAPSKPAENITQSVYYCNETQKIDLLAHIFTTKPPKRVIVFSSSKQKIKDLSRVLKRRRFNVAEMHSDLDQAERDQVMRDFKADRVDVLLATDILARGIDIDDISLVVNYDVPRDSEDYVHRIGRTARAASSGEATTFVSPKERQDFHRIEQLIEAKVPVAKMPDGMRDYSAPKKAAERDSKPRTDKMRGCRRRPKGKSGQKKGEGRHAPKSQASAKPAEKTNDTK